MNHTVIDSEELAELRAVKDELLAAAMVDRADLLDYGDIRFIAPTIEQLTEAINRATK